MRERDAHRLPLAISDFYRTPRLNVDAEMVELKTAHTDTQAVRERGRENEREREMQRNREIFEMGIIQNVSQKNSSSKPCLKYLKMAFFNLKTL